MPYAAVGVGIHLNELSTRIFKEKQGFARRFPRSELLRSWRRHISRRKEIICVYPEMGTNRS